MTQVDVTDEMVEAACRAGWYDEAINDTTRKVVTDILRAALAAMPDRYRAGWIAGRDAAATCSEKVGARWTAAGCDSNAEGAARSVAYEIRNMEPPA